MPSERWRQDFPIDWQEDDYVTRRQFAGFLTLISGGLFLGTMLLGVRDWWRRTFAPGARALRVASLGEVPVGSAKLFAYPHADDRCLLIRTGPEKFVAYNQACTHLACPVTYRRGARELYCPCHEGYFALADGRPLGGPPKRPLPRVLLSVREDGVWATGVIES